MRCALVRVVAMSMFSVDGGAGRGASGWNAGAMPDRVGRKAFTARYDFFFAGLAFGAAALLAAFLVAGFLAAAFFAGAFLATPLLSLIHI